MKIVDYETFIRMPAGTVFAEYEPCIFKSDWEIKVDRGEEFMDFWTGVKLWSYNGTMKVFPWFKDELPDGETHKYGTYETEMFYYDGSSADVNETKYFAVLEPHEVKMMIRALEWALDGCKEEWED